MRVAGVLCVWAVACSGGGGTIQGPPALGAPDYLIEVPSFEVAPGTEVDESYCASLGNAEPLLLRAFSLDASVGLHHTQLFQAGRDTNRLVFATSTLVSAQSLILPEGVVLPLVSTTRLCLGYHYLNASAAPLTANLRLGLYATEPSPGQKLAAMFGFHTRRISIPPRGSAAASFDCRFPNTVKIVTLVPHTHARGRRFIVRAAGGARDGQVIKEWTSLLDSEVARFDPPLTLEAGEGLAVSCEWDNPSTQAISYGVSATAEMCLAAGVFYPAQRDLFGEVAANGSEECVVRERLAGDVTPLTPPAD